MSKIWFCATCGYEVDAKGRCHLCRQKLIASPLPPLTPGDEDEEIGYRIVDWGDRARGRLIEALVAEGILHRFEDDDLVVGVGDEERVDQMVEELADADEDDGPFVTGVGDTAVAYTGEAEGEVVLAVELLFKSAQRLQLDPTDMEADGDVAEASAGVFMTEEYPGANPDEWAAIGRVTRRLLAALGAEEALEEEIRQEAAVLVVLLRPAVAATSTAAADGLLAVATPEPAADFDPGAGDGQASDEQASDEQASAEPAAGDQQPTDSHSDTDDSDTDASDTDDIDSDASDTDASDTDDSDTDVSDTDDSDTDVRILGGGPETSYEVPEWMPEQRALLTVLLEERAIPHAWDGADLVVPSVDEEAVEALFDEVGGVAEDDDDETRYRALEELFAAVVRLAGDPDDKQRVADVIAASGAVEGPTPIGFDDGKWLGLRRRTRTLADALEHNADPEVVASQSVSLRDALRELV